MLFYIGNLFLLAFVVYALRKKPRTMHRVAFIWVYVIAALRGTGMGADYYVYQRYFEAFGNLSLIQIFERKDMEIGYILLNKLVALFGKSYQLFLAVCSLLALLGVFYFMKSFSVSLCLSLWMYITMGFYQATFTRVRQAVAISIVLVAYEYAVKQNLKKFVFLIVCAVFFHYSAIVAIVIYPLLRKEIRLKQFFASLVGLVILYLMKNQVRALAFSIGRIFGYERKYDSVSAEGEGFYLLLVYMMIFAFVSFLYFYGRDKGKRLNGVVLYDNRLLLNFSLLAVAFQVLATTFKLFNRCGEYFAIPMMLLLPNIVEKKFEAKGRFVVKILLMIVSLVFYAYSLSRTTSTVPYRFMWE